MAEAGWTGGDGCTVGVVQVDGGCLFFKNRDLPGPYRARRVTAFQTTPDSYRLLGVNFQTWELEGVSIGVNRHRVCVANTHIASTPDVTYDLLCAELLDGVRDRDEVAGIVEAFVARHTVQGGRILVAAPGWAWLVEVLGARYELEARTGNVALTNTFSLLDYEVERPAIRAESSARRLAEAERALGAVSDVGALKGLLRSHVPEQGELSICNHRQDGGGTESSHIIHIQGNWVGWWSLVGYPCEGDYHLGQVLG